MRRVLLVIGLVAVSCWVLIDAVRTFIDSYGAPLWLRLLLSVMSVAESSIFIAAIVLSVRWAVLKFTRRAVLAVVTGLALCIPLSAGQHAALPRKLLDARTVYIDNHFSADALDAATDELRKWGRFTIVDSAKKADLVLVISGDLSAESTDIKFVDPSDGSLVWSDSRYWGKFKSATRQMLRSLRKRMTSSS